MLKNLTKTQKEMFELYKKLPSLNTKQIEFAKKQINKYYVTAYSKKHYCLECGNQWDEKVNHNIQKKTCPSCKEKLFKLTYYNSTYNCLSEEFSVATKVENVQIVRTYQVRKFLKKGKQANHSVREVLCRMYEVGKKTTMVGRTYRYNMGMYDWSGESMEIRKSERLANHPTYNFYPKFELLKILKLKGIKNSFHNINSDKLISAFMGEETIPETLWKCKQYDLLNDYLYSRFNNKPKEFWKQIKICIRNNYTVKNASDWFDYLDLLVSFGKDIHNAKYICPIDLHKEHQKYIGKAEKRRIEKKARELEEEIIANNKSYEKEKADLLDFKFSKKNLTIEPFKNVGQFLEEGTLLKHCIFTNSYFKKKNSLIFSARVNGVPTETIEYSLSEKRILQSRGKNNVPSKKNKEFLELFNSHKNEIDARIL